VSVGIWPRARSAPLVALYRQVPDRGVIDADMARWSEVRGVPASSREDLLIRLCATLPEWRNLFYFRLEAAGLRITPKLARRIWRPMPLFEIGCDRIGPGLVISHGHGTILTAESIGSDCWIHHQVTIGSDYAGGLPTIGDRVFIGAGAKILGRVIVGEGARIGANAVVVHDVPPWSTVGGVPAKVISVRRPA